ncbi:hypothetical protein BDQ17DRAFT_1237090, partial [Cyathus striatus]
INERANAQLIVQNMAMDRLNRTLYQKENQKKSDRTVLFPGRLGRHLTDSELIQAKRACEEERKREETDKKRTKEERRRKKEEKDRSDEEWKQRVAAYKNTIKEWESECARLRAEGVLRKNLPKRPGRLLRQEQSAILRDGIDEEGEGTGDETDIDS